MSLDEYDNREFDRGRCLLIEQIWLLAQAIFLSSWFPGSMFRVVLLRIFGARIGKGVVLKPGVRVKFPWRLTIGDYSWIGEDVWIDNLVTVTIGADCCISQAVYLCSGSHNWNSQGFDLITKPIVIQDKVWLAAKSVVGPGVTVREGAVLALGSVATRDLEPWRIHLGNPALPFKRRKRAKKPIGSKHADIHPRIEDVVY
jgi:putative colanic acid biosynthesis acetyltransferase WcaF